MGIIIGKFRKKKTTLEVLDNLEKRIKSIEDYGKNTEQAQKRIVGRFLILSIGVYLLTAFIFYFYFFPASFYDRLYYIIPLIFAPVIIMSTKRILTWYYHRKLKKNETNLATLKNEKKQILEKVMDTETYKIAKNILEKYAPEQVRKPSYTTASSGSESSPNTNLNNSLTGVRQRSIVPVNQTPRSITTYNLNTPSVPLSQTSTIARYKTPAPSTTLRSVNTPVPMQLPREILPRERSIIDKMVEYLVGDGPSNRYALICKQCASHNGMALKEEFDYLNFRCCYCFTINPARKKRLQAPKLTHELQALTSKSKTSDTSESEKNSGTESDATDEEITKPKTTEIKTIYDSKDKKLTDTEYDKLSDHEQKSENELGSNENINLIETEKNSQKLELKKD